MIDDTTTTACADVKTFVRNRYFYGKLLDVFHLEMEQDYLNTKRWLLNRLIAGYGVVCGLDVRPSDDGKAVIVLPGVAIDKWGREIVVPKATTPYLLPTAQPKPAQERRRYDDPEYDEHCWHLSICYHECDSDPVPGLGGDCDQSAMCAPGAIRERYELVLEEGKLPDIETDCSVQDLISGTRINYQALAQYVSSPCPDCADSPCIPLANIRLPDPGSTLQPDAIDIAVRPIVYTNDLLHDLLICLTSKPAHQEYGRGGKA